MKIFCYTLVLFSSLLFANEVKPKISTIKNVTVFLEGASIERSATLNVIPGENVLLYKTYHQILMKAVFSFLD